MLTSIHLISDITIVPIERRLQNKTNKDKKNTKSPVFKRSSFTALSISVTGFGSSGAAHNRHKLLRKNSVE